MFDPDLLTVNARYWNRCPPQIIMTAVGPLNLDIIALLNLFHLPSSF